MFKKIFLSILINTMWFSALIAAPTINSVSGNISNGGDIVITGSSFGTKPIVSPVIWDNCESGAITDKWNGIYPYAADNNTYNMQYRTTFRGVGQAHSNSTRYAVGGHAASGYSPWRNNAGPNVLLSKNLSSERINAPYFYASYYYRCDPSWPSSNDNFKLFRVSNGSELDCDNGGFYLEYNPKPTNPAYHTVYTSPGYYASDYGLRGVNPITSWIKVEVVCHMVSGTSGYIRVYENGILKYDLSNKSLSFANGTNYRMVVFGEYWRQTNNPETGNNNAFRYFDDLYFDTTLSRVIIGNKSTLESSTIREVQIPISWSSNAISVKVNQGAFANGQTAYLYIVDSNNIVNSIGYPISVGNSSDTTGPSKPTGVKVEAIQ